MIMHGVFLGDMNDDDISDSGMLDFHRHLNWKEGNECMQAWVEYGKSVRIALIYTK